MAFCISVLSVNSAWPQAGGADSVEQLRQILRGPLSDAVARDQGSKRQIAALAGIHELHQALLLREWRDLDADEGISAVDRSNRAFVATRFEASVRRLLSQGDAATKLAALKMIAEMGVSVRDIGCRKSYARKFSPDLVAILRRDDGGLRDASARALSNINPESGLAVPVFGELLRSSDPARRMTGAKSLLNLIRVAAQLSDRSQNPVTADVPVQELVETGRAIVRVAGSGMRDQDAEIRRLCVEGIAQTAASFRKLVEAACPRDVTVDHSEANGRLAEQRTVLLPLIAALGEQGPVLTQALADHDAGVRVQARQALEDMTNPQLHLLTGWLRDSGTGGDESALAVRPAAGAGPLPAKDPLAQSLQGTVSALARGLVDPDPQARRAALDLLETLGPVAQPAAPALVNSLGDSDKFVRWAAARTLGKMSPVARDSAVPAFARLLGDTDLDVQLAAAAALERYGAAARSAVPDLVRILGEGVEPRPKSESGAVHVKPFADGDPQLRVAAIRALEATGSQGLNTALGVLCLSLKHPDPRVRQQAALALGKMGPAAREAIDPLKDALQDDSPEVQKAASDALLHLAQHTRK
jgi:HEAT repeat protein